MSIKDIVDKHASEQVKVITLRLHAPLYNDHFREAKREKRRCERKDKKSIRLTSIRLTVKNFFVLQKS